MMSTKCSVQPAGPPCSYLAKIPFLTISKPNAGYYRVNYDRHNWENIARCLDTDREKFHETNRAQIIDDAFNLARAGMVGYDLVFELMRSMNEERSFIVWKAARRGFRYIQTMLSRTGAFGDIQV